MKQNEQYCREIDISIIIPAFNCAAYIEDCLKSCEIQSFQNFEIIIIDDGSTDSTKEIIHKCCATMQNKCQIIELEDNPEHPAPIVGDTLIADLYEDIRNLVVEYEAGKK